MARIKRPRLPSATTSGIARISPASAATPYLSDTAVGRQAAQIGRQLMGNAVESAQSAMYSKANREATLAFSKRVQERINNPFDDDGNPTFDTLVEDIGAIGAEIQSDISGKLYNSSVRERFEANFGNTVANQQIKGIVTASALQSQFIRNEDKINFDTYLEAAIYADTPAETRHLQAQYEEFLDQNQDEFSPAEIQERKETFRATLAEKTVDKLIAEDPLKAIQTLQEDPESLQVKPSHRGRLIAKAEKALRAQQAVNVVNLETILEATPTDKLHTLAPLVDEAESSGQVSALQAAKLRKSIVKEQNKKGARADTTQKILDSLSEGQDLSEFSTTEVGKAYDQVLEDYAQQAADRGVERELTMGDKVSVAKSFGAPIKPLADEISRAVEHGDPEASADALAAYVELTTDPDDHPILSTLTAKKRDLLDLAKSLSVTRAPDQAISAAREMMTRSSSPLGEERKQELKDLAKKGQPFSREEVKESIQDYYDTFAKNFEEARRNSPKGWRGTLSLVPDVVGALFDTEEEIPTTVLNMVEDRMKAAYISHGDVEVAKETALRELDAVLGTTEFNGGTTVMLMPLEKQYPNIDVQEARQEFESDVSQWLIENGFVEQLPEPAEPPESFVNDIIPSSSVLQQAASAPDNTTTLGDVVSELGKSLSFGLLSTGDNKQMTPAEAASRATIQADDLTIFGDENYRGSYVIIIDGKMLMNPETGEIERWWPTKGAESITERGRRMREERINADREQ